MSRCTLPALGLPRPLSALLALLRRLSSSSPRPPSSCCKLTLELDTLLAAVPLSLLLFRPELLHVLNTLDGAAVAVLVWVFCVCLYVTLVTSVLCLAGPCASPAGRNLFQSVQ